ncbi:VC0807 family protein [Pseudonocardia sp. GCM10023141]|uniref:VC0807 family protein n=1 Tax=Pseudonocardia sp. GCM10023141 TaxID=3252653 RepID=UPI00361E8DA0
MMIEEKSLPEESGSAKSGSAESAPDAGLRRVIRANVLAVVFEVVVPMVLFYGLRLAGVSQWWALMAGVVVAAPYVVWTIVRNRRVDIVALVTLSVLVLSVVLGLLSDDPRTLVIREGWTAALGGLFGAWMLVTVFVGRPAQLTLGRTIAEIKRGAEGAEAWAARWDTDARFRRGLRIGTAAFGVVLLAGAVLHIVLVYVLPIDLIALVTNVAWFGALGCLIAWHVWYIGKENLDA